MSPYLKFTFRCLGFVVSFLIKNHFIFKIYNFTFEHSPYWIIRLLVKYVRLPLKDNNWDIFLINNKKIKTKIYANNIKTAQFALSYKWHNPALNFTEKLLCSFYSDEVTWIDIGANLGLRSLFALTENKPVYLIEPNYELNKLNLKI